MNGRPEAAESEAISGNRLVYGDCLKNLEAMEPASVDLVYLDPPFKSDQNYNMLFGSEKGPDEAQVRAFDAMGDSFDILLGRDVLCNGVFNMSFDGHFCFSV